MPSITFYTGQSSVCSAPKTSCIERKYVIWFVVALFFLGIVELSLPAIGNAEPSPTLPSERVLTAPPSGALPEPAAGAQKNTLTQPSSSKTWKLSVGKIGWAIIVFLTAVAGFKYSVRILESLSERWAGARLLIKRIIPIIHIFGWAAVIYFIIAGIFAPPMETLVALTASAGIAVGFASQDILKNIFGGLMILVDRPFQVGDKIQVNEFYGEVVTIGLRTVRIVTPDDNLVSIPNSEIINQSVSNANAGQFNCQVAAEFYLPPAIDLNNVKSLARRVAGVSRYVYLNKPIAVIFKNEIHFGRSVIKMRLKAYVLDLRYEFPFMSDMTETFIRELRNRRLVSEEELSRLRQTAQPESV